MKPAVMIPTRRGSPKLVLVTLVVISVAGMVGVQMCGEQEKVHSPDMATLGENTVVVWETAGRSGVIYYARAISAPPSANGTTPQHELYRNTYAARPQIVAGKNGFMVVIEDGPVHSISLSAKGEPIGPPQELNFLGTSLCRGLGLVGDSYVFGYKRYEQKADITSVSYAFLDQRGVVEKRVYVFSGDLWTRCVVAADGRTPAMAFGTGPSNPSRVLLIAGDYSETIPAARPVAMTAFGDGWALLFVQNDGERLGVALLDRNTAEPTLFSLPKEINEDTADIGTNERGVFVSWIGGGRTQIIAVDAMGKRHSSVRSGSHAVGTRAVGKNGHCTAIWSNRNGQKWQVISVPECP